MRSDDCRQILRNWNAQNEFNHYAGAEDVGLRDGGEFGAVAENFAALSLHPLRGAQSKSQCSSDGGGPFRHSDQMDFRANHRPRPGRNSLSSPALALSPALAKALKVFGKESSPKKPALARSRVLT